MKISIITVTFNSASTIRDTLESILIQTHQDWELIIEDGTSKDETLDIVRDYEPLSKGRIRVFSEKDNGLYDAMNRALARASGDVVGFLNSDDFYHDERVLEDINRAMDGQPIDCVYGDLKFVKSENTHEVVRIWKGSQHRKGDFLKGWHPAHPTFYARRDAFLKYGVFDTGLDVSADFELMLRFIEVAGLSNQYIHRYFVLMRLGGKSTGSISNIIKGNIGVVHALKKNGFNPPKLFLFRRLLPKVRSSIMGRVHSFGE